MIKFPFGVLPITERINPYLMMISYLPHKVLGVIIVNDDNFSHPDLATVSSLAVEFISLEYVVYPEPLADITDILPALTIHFH